MGKRSRGSSIWAGWAWLTAACAVAAQTEMPVASEVPDAPEPVVAPSAASRPAATYLLGMALNVSESNGSAAGRLDTELRPFWYFKWGRFRVATGRASALLSVGRDTVDPGLNADLLQGGRFKLSGSLRLDKGRDAITLNNQSVAAPVEHTLRGRLNLAYTRDSRWSAGLTVSQDLLGRKGGALLAVGAQYRRPISSQTHWDVSVGAQWGTDLYMQSQHGVLGAPRPLGSGWESGSLGLGLTSALSDRWVVYGTLTSSRLWGAAAAAPWVERSTVTRAGLGLAYRCCS
jgi:MipA family protein